MDTEKSANKQTNKKDQTVKRSHGSGSALGICMTVLLVITCLSVVAVIMIPSPIEPIAFSFSGPLPKFEGVLEPNNKLQQAERLFEGKIVGAESIAVDSTGTFYSGLADGTIVKFEGDKVVDVVRTGTYDPACGTRELEHKCGRPLGMRFDRYGVNLIVADAYYGILKVDTRAGTISTLVSPSPAMDGEPIKFFNDLDIGRDGTIYFTATSAKWDRRNFSLALLEGDNTGRLMAYHPKTRELDVLISGLHFANGVQLSPEGDFVLVAELLTARILKYYLRGEDEGKVDVFADNLPGHPDNIRASSSGGYWISFALARKAPFSMIEFLSGRPWLRTLIAKLVSQEMFVAVAPKYGLLIELSKGGSIRRSFHDPTGKFIEAVSEVHEENGYVYLGSFRAPYLARMKL